MTDFVEAMPLKSFEYGGEVRAPRKGVFFIDRRAAQQLEVTGLLKVVKQKSDPCSATGEQPSALPVAQVSPSQTSIGSEDGGRRGRRKKQGASS